jgi:Retron-type reverse transcriptase
MSSKAALLLSIKRITQLNKGKKTAGVDGFTALTDDERKQLYLQMASQHIGKHQPRPSSRTYIKKKNGKLRPLSIPTIKDRIYQNIAKMALEPQWEVRFEPTSYGFRPKRGCHDAIDRIFKSCVHGKKKWIFEGDFKGCFDNLQHDYIMEQIEEFPNKEVIAKWLKAGYVDNNVFNETNRGSGQGSVISPLLANIALHGMEEQLGIKYKTWHKRNGYRVTCNNSKYSMTRYADDFVVICETKEDAEAVYALLKPYLVTRGLELEPCKTRVVKITEGFDFLGFNVRMYNTSTGNKLLIKPSKEAVKKSRKQIAEKVRSLYGSSISEVIKVLNPIIRGKANYWAPEVSKDTFASMDHFIHHTTYRFLKRLHHNKSGKWIYTRYYKPDNKGISKSRWILTDLKNNIQLQSMSATEIVRHTMITHNSSPFDADLKQYFMRRDNKEFISNNNMALLLNPY